MKAVTVEEMRSLEDAAINQGISEEQLMDLAGARLADSISAFFPNPGTIVGYLGKGHNAGDACIALRILRDRYRWNIHLRTAFPPSQASPLAAKKFAEIGDCGPVTRPFSSAGSTRPLVLLDALVGIGAKGPLRPPLDSLAEEINRLRLSSGAKTAALDLPSGLDPDTGTIHPGAVTADVTFTIGAAKAGLLPEAAANSVGSLAIVPVGPLSPPSTGDRFVTTPASIHPEKLPRPYHFHKGNAGRVGILAGSTFYSGAAILAATGALRGGAGLVTLYVPPDSFEIIAAKAPPELMVRPCAVPTAILSGRHDSLVIGCGLKMSDAAFRESTLELISQTELPTLLDAEALGLFTSPDARGKLKVNHLLTPHPGEFARLAPELSGLSREDSVKSFSASTPATLLLKGCRTLVAHENAAIWTNPTGTPGMASGGQGDLLSGVIGALLAMGNPLPTAASFGAWLCGRAAERTLDDSHISPESLLPTDVARHLGGAFNDWRQHLR